MLPALLSELQTLARTLGGELDWFADRMEGLTLDDSVMPRRVDVLDSLAERVGPATELTAPVTHAALAARDMLHWTQSYTPEDGFNEGYLENYGFVNIVSPVGHFRSDEMRISIGFWGEGLRYPEHAHEPEEWYVMLAGGCDLTSEGLGTRPVMAGQSAYHRPWQRHSADFKNTSLLAAAFWRGGGLMDKSILYETT